MAFAAQAADTAVGTIGFRRIDNEPLIAFATRFFYKRHPHAVNWSFARRYRTDENWSAIVHGEVYSSEVDLDDDGTPELVLLVDNTNWCDAGGCLSAIFRHVPKGYELICETALPPPESAAPVTVLAMVEHGYHRLATKDLTVVWNARQDYDSGLLCATESRED
jgi:hypothetical protein